MKIMNLVAVLAALVASTSLGLAAEPTLKVGDPAPKLQTGKWIQGEPVKSFEPGKAYIVEFWATWCGPCRATIPHVNNFYKKFKDKGLIVIGQDCWEQDESKVEPFVKQMGDKMTYLVALDDKNGSEKGKMAETWMQAAGRDGIPSAFLVDTKGKIAWIGHPMELKDKTIEAVLAGTFDVKKAAAEQAEEEKAQAAVRPKIQQLSKAMSSKDWDEADKVLTEIEKMLPAERRQGLSRVRLQILIGKEDFPAVYKAIAQMSEDGAQKMAKGDLPAEQNAAMQNELAWRLLTDKKLKDPDLKLAEKIAVRANEAAESKQPAILDTLARAYFVNGKKDKAIEAEEKAIKLAEGDMKSNLEETLTSYKKGELPKGEK